MNANRFRLFLGILCLLLLRHSGKAATYYVNASNTTPVAPFTAWATAATNIQDAINITSPGDTVLVTNGAYAYSGLAITGGLLNRVALTNAITVQSVNGPWVTTIFGGGATNGPNAVRCAWLTNGASLIGFTLTAGATQTSGNTTTTESGGGAWCASASNSLIANCVIVSNTAQQNGSGVYQGAIVNSLVNSNNLGFIAGGAAYESVLDNCTVVGNFGYGVASPVAMTNCIIYYNGTANYSSVGKASHCCTTPALGGAGNFTNAPQLFADGVHLATNSPCIGAGTNPVTGTDIFGLTWANPPSVGCAEWNPAPVIFPQPEALFPTTGGVVIGVNADGQPPLSFWWTKDGAPVQNNGHYSGANSAAIYLNSVSLSDAGAYQIVVSNSFGMVSSAVSQISAHCVSASGTEQPPYSNWATAATNIQDAINVAQAGDFIFVTNGVYAFGGLAMDGNLTNRAALNLPVLVQSVNGPWVTTIFGAGGTSGNFAIRCAWLTNGAALIGFTLQAGATRGSGDAGAVNGGGVFCAASNALVENCVIVSNTANEFGGGVYQGTVVNSLISSNGTSFGSGGASYGSVLNNCTLVSNATYGALSPIAMTNCILYYNTTIYGNYSASGSAFVNCCTTPALAGAGNFTNPPQFFVDGVHLSTNSPCIRAGVNAAIGTDIFGQTWSNPPSIGCAEWQPSPVVTLPQLQPAGNPDGLALTATFSGLPPFAFSWLHNGVPLQDNGIYAGSQTPTLNVAWSNPADAGGYQLVISNAFGVVTSAVAQVVIHLVNVNGANPTPPYSTWATAATDIQDAITAAAVGDIVLVTNGLYATGGISMDGVITNRVSVNKAVFVQSINGPNATVIQGAQDPTSTTGPGAVRCVWMTNGAVLGGFTIYGGSTRASPTSQAVYGGGVWGPTNKSPGAIVSDCIILNNAANLGGGAYQVSLNYCTIATNTAMTTSGTGGSGGGAYGCNLKNCVVMANVARGGSGSAGGGLDNCNAQNSALTMNTATSTGGGAYGSSLVNCTLTGNQAGSAGGGGVASASLTNCILYLNQVNNSTLAPSSSNYYASTLNYCCTAPAASGAGNISSDPLLIADGVHVSATSPCIGAGNAAVVSGTDIDGQPWNNPPSIGCDEWYPEPVVGAQPAFQVGLPAHGLTCTVVVAGQAPFACFWTQNGTPIQDNGHFSNSGTTSFVINNFGPADAGVYQVVVTNSFGAVTSAAVQLVIHAVNAAGINPVAPYSTWATAATNIQDAINAALAGDIILVTNGLYRYGGIVVAGSVTNRVAINLPITVTSVNGCFATAIQGAWDPISTNGPDAVRCAWLSNGAVLMGFTLQNGASGANDGPVDSSDSGGGVYCPWTNVIVVNCVLSNNIAIYGGGIANGTLNNSLVLNNQADQGGGAYSATLDNCTVEGNNAFLSGESGGGTYGCFVKNSIVVNNTLNSEPFGNSINYYNTISAQFSYSCSSPVPSGTGNINANPQFLDLYHISTTTPCLGTGNAAYAIGTDLDGVPWNNPPSMGCSEVVLSNLVGPLSVTMYAPVTNLVVNRPGALWGYYTGHASSNAWSYGDGALASDTGGVLHEWTNSGIYTVTFTAYNNSNPAGVSTNIVVQVQPLQSPQLQSPVVVSNAFQFQFAAQGWVNYTAQYATNLTPPVTWQTLQTIYLNQKNVIQISDPSWTNGARFYQILAQ